LYASDQDALLGTCVPVWTQLPDPAPHLLIVPWRQAYGRMSWRTRPGDEQFTLASEALDQVWLDRVLSRARRSLSSVASWPDGLENDLGGSVSMLYVTPEEAKELHAVLMKTFEQTIGQGPGAPPAGRRAGRVRAARVPDPRLTAAAGRWRRRRR
jgi:hypothetical protein